jgi:hypothetical protein
MSTYATIQGSIQFDKKEAYEKVVQILTDGGWIDSAGNWRNEIGDQIGDDGLYPSQMKINIPLGYYRNLLGILDAILAEASAVSGKWASTDGMFSGGDLGSQEEIDLRKWADEQGFEEPPDDDDFENMSIWMDEVIDFFMTGNFQI